ncbi:MAG: acyl carrier protein [Lachnospiraceae bacterium]|nr:acyl carrier protein [Lachnospiraceae bacterium]
MTREEAYGIINPIFRDLFDDETITVNDETTAADVDGWDSFEHVNLLLEIENAFGFTFSINETRNMKNVGEMVDLILKKTDRKE